jgi:hypothetical protein
MRRKSLPGLYLRVETAAICAVVLMFCSSSHLTQVYATMGLVSGIQLAQEAARHD